MASHETNRANPEHQHDTAELERIATERKKDIAENLETRSPERQESTKTERLESARHEVEKHLERHQDSPEQHTAPKELRQRTDPKTSFKNVMSTARSQMSTPSRTFSKVIHNPAVEKTSDAIGTTIARPNAVLSGSVFAFVLTLAFYLIGRWFGYPLSGFETIGAFILGWVIGVLYDFLKVMITGKKA